MENYITERSYGYVDPNFPNPGGERDTPVIIYGYTPSIALAAFAAAWFFLHFVYHTAQTIKTRSWWWMTFSAGLIFEVIGYIARSLSAKKDPYHLIYFILNYFFIVVAPVLLAAGIYTILSVLIPRVGTKYLFLPPKIILAFFITSDVISTIVQVAGACLIGITESRREDPTTANNILLGGLAYQSKWSWALLLGFFHFDTHGLFENYLRTIFRLAETGQGLMGELQTNEVYFACLEFAPIALVALLFAVWYPGRCVGAAVRVNDKP
ncbi:hypothetical protein N7449_009858 [Penicillium cf. viridicatum]|uniref:Uncharacterized protein n=1 Tax=Penicillium cf. viridicatum TaxID=2972119 RepID=A0A9W9M318_9EURO|nr:hypothetical protein N7449_009858 [Penicillium cf. viridicatum]